MNRRHSSLLTLFTVVVALPAALSACAVNGTYALDPQLKVPVYIGPAPIAASSAGERTLGRAGWSQDTSTEDIAFGVTEVTTTTTTSNALAASIARGVAGKPGAFAADCTFQMDGSFGDESVWLACDTMVPTGGAK